MATNDKEIAARVFARFAAQVDEKMLALLMKLRKGSDSSLTVAQLHKVLELLGGWKIEKTIVPLEFPWGQGSIIEGGEDFVKQRHAEYKAKEGPLPTSLVKDRDYIVSVEDIRPESEHWKSWSFGFKAVRGAPGFKYTAPNGKIFIDKPAQDWYFKSKKLRFWMYDLKTWLKKETPYLQQISEKLEIPTYEKEREDNPGAAFRTRENTGTCPCCFRNIKLKPGDQKIVLHGYKRPGWGSVHGSCHGVGWLPFELSKDGTVNLVKNVLEPHLKTQEKYLQRLEAGEITVIYSQVPGRKPLKKEELDVVEWETKLADEIRGVRISIDHIERDMKLLNGLISKWELKPLPFANEKVKPPPTFLL